MPSAFKLKPTHRAVRSYYAALATYADPSVKHEGALRFACQSLLAEMPRQPGNVPDAEDDRSESLKGTETGTKRWSRLD